MLKKSIASLFLLWSLLALAPVHAQNTFAPPRNINDIIATLDQYKPDPKIAENAVAMAQKTAPDTVAPEILRDFYLERSRAAARIGRIRQQIADLRQAYIFPRGRSVGIPFELGIAEMLGGNFQNAKNVMLRLTDELPSLNRPGALMMVYAALASSLAEIGDRTQARQALSRAEEWLVAASFGRPEMVRWHGHTWAARLERARASTLLAEGKIIESQRAWERALHEMDVDVKFSPTRIKARTDTDAHDTILRLREQFEISFATALSGQGKLVDAEIHSRNALLHTLSRVGRYSPDTGSALTALAGVIFAQGRFQEAASIAALAIDSLEQSGAAPESLSLADARRRRAAALVMQENWQDALDEFDRMWKGISVDSVLAQALGGEDIDWGFALIKVRESERAVTMLETLLAKTQQQWGELDYQTAEVHGHLAIALASRGDLVQALQAFRAVIPILVRDANMYQQPDSANHLRIARLARVLEAYLHLLSNLHKSDRAPHGLDVIAESFRIANAARFGNVQLAVSASAARASISDQALSDLARQEQDTRQRIGTLKKYIERLLRAPREQQLTDTVSALRTEIAELSAKQTDLRKGIEERYPSYSDLIDPKPATLEQARAALKTGEALISILVTGDTTYVWAIPQVGAPAFSQVPLGEKAVAKMITQLRTALDIGNAAVARFSRFDTSISHRLYSDLLRPVETSWKDASSLIIVPHRALGQMPFSLLVTAPAEVGGDTSARFDSYRTVPWLLRKAAVTQLPSVNALTALRALPPATGYRHEFIGFGDPYFSKKQQTEEAAPGNAPVASVGANLRNLSIHKVALPTVMDIDGASGSTLRNAPKVANSSTLAQLARLPETADEIRDIAQALKADMNTDVFLGVRANERNVKDTNLADRKVIAFATHGLVPGDLNGLEQPALALTAPDVAGIDGDGLLTMEEVLGLKLNADWVVLSACNTGSGEGAGSEAVSGLGRAFFYAGARSLLVSNWPVETVSARLLTADVFKRSAENPTLTRAEVLRQTMLWLMDSAGQRDASGKWEFTYAHPLFWAPFTLIGDGGK